MASGPSTLEPQEGASSIGQEPLHLSPAPFLSSLAVEHNPWAPPFGVSSELLQARALFLAAQQEVYNVEKSNERARTSLDKASAQINEATTQLIGCQNAIFEQRGALHRSWESSERLKEQTTALGYSLGYCHDLEVAYDASGSSGNPLVDWFVNTGTTAEPRNSQALEASSSQSGPESASGQSARVRSSDPLPVGSASDGIDDSAPGDERSGPGTLIKRYRTELGHRNVPTPKVAKIAAPHPRLPPRPASKPGSSSASGPRKIPSPAPVPVERPEGRKPRGTAGFEQSRGSDGESAEDSEGKSNRTPRNSSRR
jgi:hypothetical protein